MAKAGMGWALGMGAAAGAAAWLLAQDDITTDPAGALPRAGLRRRFIATPSGRMALHEGGEGPTLLFLHGIGAGASSWLWHRLAPRFLPTHRVVAADWVGWGLSERPRRPLLFADYAAQAAALLDALDGPVIAVAQSFAAGFLLDAAERRPGRVARAVLHTPAGARDFRGPPGEAARLALRALLAGPGFAIYRAAFHRRASIRLWLDTQGFRHPSRVGAEEVEGFLHFARMPGAAWSALPFLSGALAFDLAPILRRTAVPATILWPEGERQVGPETGRRLGALRPDMPFHWVPDARALPELEHPVAVEALVRAALGP